MTAQKCAEEAMALSEKLGLVAFSATATINHAAALIAQGRYEQGIAEMPRSATSDPRVSRLLASGLGKVGRCEEGLQVLEEGFASVTKTGAQLHSPWLHHVKGELLLVQNPSDVAEAERSFRTAIDIARRQSARSAELVATTSLARSRNEQGRRDEARAMLAEIYNWFTEGFDTADLKDAKALLDELGA
jgi:predicted ATPase